MRNLKIINFIKYFVYICLVVLLGYTVFLGLFTNSQYFYFFKFTFFEAIYLFLTLLNIILLIELYNFFSKSMNESEKKDKFIFEILEYVSIGLLSKELVELKNEIDYKKYLLITRNIKNRLALLKNISENSLFFFLLCSLISLIPFVRLTNSCFRCFYPFFFELIFSFFHF